MSETLWLAAAVVLNLAGMAGLALAMETHWRQVMHHPATKAIRARRLLRALGSGALVLSLHTCLIADRPSMAVLVWVMLSAASAVAVAMTLARFPAKQHRRIRQDKVRSA
jgi:hypothetical protein